LQFALRDIEPYVFLARKRVIWVTYVIDYIEVRKKIPILFFGTLRGFNLQILDLIKECFVADF